MYSTVSVYIQHLYQQIPKLPTLFITHSHLLSFSPSLTISAFCMVHLMWFFFYTSTTIKGKFSQAWGGIKDYLIVFTSEQHILHKRWYKFNRYLLLIFPSRFCMNENQFKRYYKCSKSAHSCPDFTDPVKIQLSPLWFCCSNRNTQPHLVKNDRILICLHI